MAIRRALLLVSLMLLLTPAIAMAQSSLDLSLATSYPINSTTAYDTNNTAVHVYGDIRLLEYDSGTYATIPTDAPDGSMLSFFQDTGTWVLFRNDTLLLPISDSDSRVAGLVLTTDDLTCSNGTFYGQVTGFELDTKALGEGDAMAEAILYLSKWPDNPEYIFAVSDDAQIKKAIQDAAAKDGSAGNIELMLDARGDSVGYAIVRMKAAEASGNVSAFLYRDGDVTKLTCKEFKANDSAVYETIYSGTGTFAFVGPFPEPPPERASMRDVLSFSGILCAGLLMLTGIVITVLKKANKKG